MAWLVMWIILLIVSAGGVIVSAHGVAFERGVERDMRALEDRAATMGPPVPARDLPPVVERYLTLAGASGGNKGTEPGAVRITRMSHTGEMRTGPEARWMPVRGRQVFAADLPGFVWWGRMRIAPGLWVDARDELTADKANMLVLAESIFTLGDVSTPEIEEGAAIRALGEMVLFPTAFRDARHVRWEAVDPTHARAFLTLRGREVSALFEFGPDGLPVQVSARRYRDVNGGAVLTPWRGGFGDYRDVNGLRVPFRLDSTWDLESGPFHCIRFVVESIEHERAPAGVAARALPVPVFAEVEP